MTVLVILDTVAVVVEGGLIAMLLITGQVKH